MKSRKLSMLLILPVLIVLIKMSLDYFAFYVSRDFGIYGVHAVGGWFSSDYYISWMIVLLVAGLSLPYFSVCSDVIDYSVVFLFLATFLPAASVFWVVRGSLGFLLFCGIFWLACFFIYYFLARVRPWKLRESDLARVSPYEVFFSYLYAAMLLVMLANLLYNFHIGFDFGFASVYARRKEFSEWLSGPWTYPYGWSVYVFSVFLIFTGFQKKLKLLAIIYVLIFYLVAGDKVYLFLVPLLAAILALRRVRHPVLTVTFSFLCVLLMGALSGSIWIEFVVNRFVVLPLDIAFNYVKFFSNDLLFYSYSFLSEFSKYKYDMAPANIIGNYYYLKGDGANVNFLANAFVNFGWLAIFPLLLFFTFIRFSFRRSRYLILLCPMFVQLINIPLPTVILTGGGFLMVLSCLVLSSDVRMLLHRQYQV